jgi:hypothetical protein
LDLPPQQVTTNKDGTKTIVSWRINDEGKKVKTTRRIRTTVVKEVVSPRVAERKGWGKFGLSQKDKPGPAMDTTTVGENIIFKPSINWRKDAKEEKPEQGSMKDKLKDKKVKCRICTGEHFTAKCPYKDTMAPVGEEGSADVAAGMPAADDAGGLGAGKSSYVPPHLRGGAAAAAGGDRMGGGKFERDDLATLRVTNVRICVEIIAVIVLTNTYSGLGIGRRRRAAPAVLQIWPRHKGVPGQGQGDRYGKGLRIYLVHQPRRCCEGVQRAGRLRLQASYSESGVRKEGYLNGFRTMISQNWGICLACNDVLRMVIYVLQATTGHDMNQKLLQYLTSNFMPWF